MRKTLKKAIALLLACTLTIPAVSGTYADAAKKKVPSFSTTKIDALKAGSTKKITIRTNGVKKITKVTWKSNKKYVGLIGVSKKSATVKGINAGESSVTATVKYKVKAKSKTLTKTLKCLVTVVAGSDNNLPASDPSVTVPAQVTVTPTLPAQVPPSNTQNAGPTTDPIAPATLSPTDVPTEKPTAGPTNLVSALGRFVTNVGTCISYGGGWGWGGGETPVADADTTAYIKENFNSLTAENEMKPESILGGRADLVSVNNAKAEGIIVPDSYKDVNVPRLNYTNIDRLCKFAKENGVRVRYHGLLWHEQMSNWFFRENFSAGGKYVTPDVMDARIEYYITNVMEYVYKDSYEYKDVIYCWDVLNEYHHMTECICRIRGTESPLDPEDLDPKDKGENVKCFYEVYGGAIFENPSDPAHSPVKTNPEYVKKAFRTAYEILEKHNLTDKVELVYNDYDTNMEPVRNTALGVTSYINAKDELNPDGKKYCTTIGMQCHDRMTPKWTIESHKATMDAFREAGMNFQVTEMDLQRKDKTEEEQLQYWADFVTLIINEVKQGATVTGFTWWGMTDSASWIGSAGSPLLCGNSVKDKKPAYYKVIETAYANY